MRSVRDLCAAIAAAHEKTHIRLDQWPTEGQLKEFGLRCYRMALADAKARAVDRSPEHGQLVAMAVSQIDLDVLDRTAEQAQEDDDRNIDCCREECGGIFCPCSHSACPCCHDETCEDDE